MRSFLSPTQSPGGFPTVCPDLSLFPTHPGRVGLNPDFRGKTRAGEAESCPTFLLLTHIARAAYMICGLKPQPHAGDTLPFSSAQGACRPCRLGGQRFPQEDSDD